MKRASDDPAVNSAAIWLADQKNHVEQTVPTLCERFGLTAAEAALACTLANKVRVVRRTHR